jgi:hypothetical protein
LCKGDEIPLRNVVPFHQFAALDYTFTGRTEELLLDARTALPMHLMEMDILIGDRTE